MAQKIKPQRVERDVPSHPPLKTMATIRTLNSPSNVECLKFGFQILEPCPKKPGKENKTTATFVARETTVSTVTHVTKKRLFRFRLFCLPDLPSRNPGRTQMHRRVRTHRRGERRSRGGAYANAYNSGTKEVSQVRPNLLPNVDSSCPPLKHTVCVYTTLRIRNRRAQKGNSS